jgi:hypothetical protein
VKFFDLESYFKTNFTLINNFSWNLFDIENMVYWERDIYVNLVLSYQEKKQQEMHKKMHGQEFYSI